MPAVAGLKYTSRVRDKLHDYLLQRPAGAAARELVDIVFSQRGGDPQLVEQVLADLLRDDTRFHFRAEDGTWHAAAHTHLSQPLSETTFVVLDLEMTGMEPSRTAIIEVGAARVRNGKILEEYQQLVHPGIKLPPFIVGLTGINDGMLAEQPDIATVWPALREFIGDAVLVAHNTAFDIGFLNQTSLRFSGRPLDNEQLCTLKLARHLLPQLGRRGLEALAAHFGIPHADKHRALGDVRVTVEVLFRLLEQLEAVGARRLGDALEYQNRARDGRPFVCMLPRDKVAQLPEVPGIYRLLDEAGELLYVGRAKNLRERVSTYLSNASAHSDKTLELIRNARDVRVQTVGSELEAALEEAAAIHLERPPFNQLGRHLPRVAFLKLSSSDDYPRLSIAKKLRHGKATYIGPFRNRREAERVLDLLTREFKLRTCPGALRPDPAFVPCAEARRDACTAPCAGLVDRSRYGTQVERLMAYLRGAESELERGLAERHRQRLERRQYEGAARTQRDLEVLRTLADTMRELSWMLETTSWVVFEPAIDRALVLAYAVCDGRLAVRARLSDPAEIDAFAERVRLARRGEALESMGTDIDGTTILASWLRERPTQRGYVAPLDGATSGVPEPTVEEWRRVCGELLDLR